jgi:hypothetical protein
MDSRLELVVEAESTAEEPMHGRLGRWARWPAAVVGFAGVLFLMVWCEGAEQRAIRNMPEGERHALFVRTLQNLKSVCTAPEEAMHAYCAEQARIALEFSECDPACQALASRQISRVPRPR